MSETVTMTLTEFLLARYAEEEELARNPGWLAFEYGVEYAGREAFSDRVLTECEAKREIVAVHNITGGHECPAGPDRGNDGSLAGWFEDCPTLKYLALPYADHPDFRPEWKP